MDETASGFRLESVTYLRDTYLPRIERALEVLPAEDVWWRPHDDATSVGNLLAHLTGNVRQWIVSGLGGAQDHRERAAEFHRDRREAGPALLADLRTAVLAACEVIERLPDEQVRGAVTIQGFETTGLRAIYHVVEHFSWHTGQIAWIAKLRAGPRHGLAYYDEERINRARNA